MIFEFGKTYIVDVTEKGITPLMIFDEDRWYDKDHDDLDFLTDEEKIVVINDVLDMIKAELETNTEKWWYGENSGDCFVKLSYVLEIIDNCRKSVIEGVSE